MFKTRRLKSRHHLRRTRCAPNGIEALELAMILPVILVLGLGATEFSRALQVQQVLTNAAREGTRQAILPKSTVDEVETVVAEYLKIGKVDAVDATVETTPTSLNGLKSGTEITVVVKVPYSKVSWLASPRSLGDVVLSSHCTMRHE